MTNNSLVCVNKVNEIIIVYKYHHILPGVLLFVDPSRSRGINPSVGTFATRNLQVDAAHATSLSETSIVEARLAFTNLVI